MRTKKRTKNSVTPFSPIQTLLEGRGIEEKDYNMIFKPTKEEERDDYEYENMREAVECFRAHMGCSSDIGIIVDSDCDGVTSSSMLYMFLRSKYPKNDIKLFFHEGKQHGLSSDVYYEIYNSNIDLLFIPDAGSSDYEQLEKLSLIMDIIVLDHHECERYSSHAIVVNNQMSKGGNKSLTGVGMTYKFIRSINKTESKKYLDLVAIGQVADVSDARVGETRWLMYQGINQINKDKYSSEFIKAIKEFRLGKKKATIMGIGFYIAPFINACCRMGDKTTNEVIFRAIVGEGDVKYALEMCKGLKESQDSLVERGYLELVSQIDNFKFDSKAIMVCNGTSLYPSIKGLVANKLASEYRRPCLVLADKGNELSGSGRGYEDGYINNLKGYLQGLGIFEFVAGHKSALGCSILKEKVHLLYDIIDRLPCEEEEKEYLIDGDYNTFTLTQDLVRSVGECEHLWGNGLDEPLFLVTQVQIPRHQIKLLGKDIKETVKFSINGIDFIKFKVPKEELMELDPNPLIGYPRDEIIEFNVVGRFVISEFAGRKTPQVQVVEWEFRKGSFIM